MPKSNRKLNKERQKSYRKIYLDYASSALSTSANPGAIHELGVQEKNKLEKARTTVAQILGAHSNEIIFTSGATESNNLAIMGFISASFERRTSNVRKMHIVTTNIEHASVLEVCRHLEKTKQTEVTYVEVEKNGIVDPEKIRKALKPNTVLVSVMYANNEIGTIQPIREIAKIIRHFKKQHEKRRRFLNGLAGRGTRGTEDLRKPSPFFHVDATQAINYLPINVQKLGVDLMSMNSAKIYGPKGIGVLYVRKHTPIQKIMFGGDQEFGLRPGTENTTGAVGLANALRAVEKIKEKEVKRLTKLRNYFFEKIFKNTRNSAIAENLGNLKIILNGDRENRLPNNINITVPNIPSDLLVIELSAQGIFASAKSACKAGDGKASYVIQAIDKNIKETDGSLRFSLGRSTSKKDVDQTVKALSKILLKLKKWYN